MFIVTMLFIVKIFFIVLMLFIVIKLFIVITSFIVTLHYQCSFVSLHTCLHHIGCCHHCCHSVSLLLLLRICPTYSCVLVAESDGGCPDRQESSTRPEVSSRHGYLHPARLLAGPRLDPWSVSV